MAVVQNNSTNSMLDTMAVRSWSKTGMCAVYSTNLFLLERWTGRYTLPSLVVLSCAKAVPCLALSVSLSAHWCQLTHVPSPPLDTGHYARPTQLIHTQILHTIIPKQFFIIKTHLYLLQVMNSHDTTSLFFHYTGWFWLVSTTELKDKVSAITWIDSGLVKRDSIPLCTYKTKHGQIKTCISALTLRKNKYSSRFTLLYWLRLYLLPYSRSKHNYKTVLL